MAPVPEPGVRAGRKQRKRWGGQRTLTTEMGTLIQADMMPVHTEDRAAKGVSANIDLLISYLGS